MFDNIHIMDTLRDAGFEAGEIKVTCEPGVRDVTITGISKGVLFAKHIDIATEAARALADAGYDIICYGEMNDGQSLASLLVRVPETSLKVA